MPTNRKVTVVREKKLNVKVTEQNKGELTLEVSNIYYDYNYHTMIVQMDMDKLTKGSGVDLRSMVINPEKTANYKKGCKIKL